LARFRRGFTLQRGRSIFVKVWTVWQQLRRMENYFLPGDLETQIDNFVGHYNHRRYHESLGNLTPADVYFGRGQTILLERERIKKQTIEKRRLLHAQAAA
jgi:transposase InsO family protein